MNFRLSPAGLFFYQFGENSSNKIILSGGFLNMCITNTLEGLTTAFISSAKKSMNFYFSQSNTYIQQDGKTPYLTFQELGNYRYSLGEIIQEFPNTYRQIKIGLKKYMEEATFNQIEVVWGKEKPLTKKPFIRMKILNDN